MITMLGIGFTGTQAELRGCINDVWTMKSILTTHYGFQDADITVMIDTDPAYTKPTGKAMKVRQASRCQLASHSKIVTAVAGLRQGSYAIYMALLLMAASKPPPGTH